MALIVIIYIPHPGAMMMMQLHDDDMIMMMLGLLADDEY